jgi:hypothetical protein
MEVFSILLCIPVAAVASTAYSYPVARLQLINHGPGLALVRFVSGAIQVSIILEIVMLVLVGAVEIRTVVGPAFGKIHEAAFLGGAPALANLLVPWKERRPRTVEIRRRTLYRSGVRPCPNGVSCVRGTLRYRWRWRTF